jgi:hypothetical protein
MCLVLDLVLEYADTATLLNCMFIDKHVHGVVMRILDREFTAIRDMSDRNNGDIFLGIQCGNPELHHRILEIYGRLYPFNINPIWNTRYRKHVIFDFITLSNQYYHKMPLHAITFIICVTFRRYMYLSDYCHVFLGAVHNILTKGFDVNLMINIVPNHKTTILIHALMVIDPVMVELVLDAHPDILLEDELGMSAISVFDSYFKVNVVNTHVCSDQVMACRIIDKFNTIISHHS